MTARPGRATVCACIIARNEEGRLPAALDSVAFCDELVVVDSGSHDRTMDLARAAGARVIEHPWRGFGAQRNVAIDAATSDWILEVDADERVTPQLRAEIEAFLDDPPAGVDICAVPCRDLFLGGRLGPSSKYPKYRLRLFRRGVYRHDETLAVHEGLWAWGPTHAFEGDLEHVLADTLPEAVRDARAYARLEAGQLGGAPDASARIRGMALRPLAKFAYRLVIDGGWRDGWRGLAKIGLDCWADALVWVFARGDAAKPAPAHYAQERVRRGPVRLLVIASGEHNGLGVARWLMGAQAAGADVGLVTLERLTPLRLIRALDAEFQLRGVDALVPWGPRERRLARLLPPDLRAPYPLVDPHADPAEAVRMVQEATR